MNRLLRNTPTAVAAAIVLIAATVLVTTSVVALRADSATSTAPLRIAVVGDYYSAGTQNLEVWPTLMAARTGWAVSNAALPGAGYAADGRGAYAFTYQVDRAQATAPDIVLIVGGTSDTGFDAAQVEWGATDALNKIVLGGGRGLVVGPTWYTEPVPAEVTRVSEAVRGRAEAAGIPFLDALHPPWLTPELMSPDFTGPTDGGQSVLADRIAEWIRAEVGS